jgi:hypothetical protein
MRNPIPAVAFVAHIHYFVSHQQSSIYLATRTHWAVLPGYHSHMVCLLRHHCRSITRARNRTFLLLPSVAARRFLFSRFAFPCHEHATPTFAVKTWQHYWHRVHTAAPVVAGPATHFYFYCFNDCMFWASSNGSMDRMVCQCYNVWLDFLVSTQRIPIRFSLLLPLPLRKESDTVASFSLFYSTFKYTS